MRHDGRLWLFAFVGGNKLFAAASGVTSAEIPFALPIQGRGFAGSGFSAYALQAIAEGSLAEVVRERVARFIEVLETLP